MPKKKKARTCGECSHEFACAMWNVGNLRNTDATNCTNYETVRDSAAYFIGFMEGKKESDKHESSNNQM